MTTAIGDNVLPTPAQIERQECLCRKGAKNPYCPKHGQCQRRVLIGSGRMGRRQCCLSFGHRGGCE